jgi:hypothetical protein
LQLRALYRVRQTAIKETASLPAAVNIGQSKGFDDNGAARPKSKKAR